MNEELPEKYRVRLDPIPEDKTKISNWFIESSIKIAESKSSMITHD
jgi:hypothetical protein